MSFPFLFSVFLFALSTFCSHKFDVQNLDLKLRSERYHLEVPEYLNHPLFVIDPFKNEQLLYSHILLLKYPKYFESLLKSNALSLLAQNPNGIYLLALCYISGFDIFKENILLAAIEAKQFENAQAILHMLIFERGYYEAKEYINELNLFDVLDDIIFPNSDHYYELCKSLMLIGMKKNTLILFQLNSKKKQVFETAPVSIDEYFKIFPFVGSKLYNYLNLIRKTVSSGFDQKLVYRLKSGSYKLSFENIETSGYYKNLKNYCLNSDSSMCSKIEDNLELDDIHDEKTLERYAIRTLKSNIVDSTLFRKIIQKSENGILNYILNLKNNNCMIKKYFNIIYKLFNEGLIVGIESKCFSFDINNSKTICLNFLDFTEDSKSNSEKYTKIFLGIAWFYQNLDEAMSRQFKKVYNSMVENINVSAILDILKKYNRIEEFAKLIDFGNNQEVSNRILALAFVRYIVKSELTIYTSHKIFSCSALMIEFLAEADYEEFIIKFKASTLVHKFNVPIEEAISCLEKNNFSQFGGKELIDLKNVALILEYSNYFSEEKLMSIIEAIDINWKFVSEYFLIDLFPSLDPKIFKLVKKFTGNQEKISHILKFFNCTKHPYESSNFILESWIQCCVNGTIHLSSFTYISNIKEEIHNLYTGLGNSDDDFEFVIMSMLKNDFREIIKEYFEKYFVNFDFLLKCNNIFELRNKLQPYFLNWEEEYDEIWPRIVEKNNKVFNDILKCFDNTINRNLLNTIISEFDVTLNMETIRRMGIDLFDFVFNRTIFIIRKLTKYQSQFFEKFICPELLSNIITLTLNSNELILSEFIKDFYIHKDISEKGASLLRKMFEGISSEEIVNLRLQLLNSGNLMEILDRTFAGNLLYRAG